MEWRDIFPSGNQPTMDEIAEYIGGEAKQLWQSLLEHMDAVYKVKPKMTYSGCSGKPGWNIKLQKSGVSFGTLYPEEGSFSVFLVISYKLEPLMESIITKLSPGTAELYKQAGDYMKMGKWMMFQIADSAGVEDYKLLAEVKMLGKNI
ncbi:DUF3788 domain-containing protein [Lutispora saccharofermentans]|uniref:DUF3788 domain-containing protein n=1 Tax=Lutispora saccharofermentans TaxID=3024236 RepID=A0ABT1NFM3_9FIRM|nr:DUF3788 domain-containing protein [Lutispora saccharofermentans]MCQ1530039.1 DUF3788 domain-containing protein [Lutispora saccharofermentans]